MRRTTAVWLLVLGMVALVGIMNPASAAGNRNPVRLRFAERACTFTATARWHQLDFTPTQARFDFYRFGVLVSEVTNPLSSGDTTSVATYAGTQSTSNQFWVDVYLERAPGDLSPASAYSDTIVANCT